MAAKGGSRKRARSAKEQSQFDNKCVLMQLLLEEKRLLRSELNSNVTVKKKKVSWKTIHDRLVSEYGINLVPQDKDFTYLRDTVFAQLKIRYKVIF